MIACTPGALVVAAFVALLLWCSVVAALLSTLNLAARLARYRTYRRSYPAAPRGRVWRHVR